MYKYRISLIVLLCIILNISYAQHKEIILKNSPLKSVRDRKEYLPKTVVFKIKPEIKPYFVNQEKKSPLFTKVTKELGDITIEKMFPYSQTPDRKKNRLGHELSDISLIYVLQYSANLSVEVIAEKIKKTGYVEYAEPYYVDKILFVPDDRYAHPDSAQGFYFSAMKLYEAFDIEDGDTNVVIGIIDTGVKWDHEDLQNQIKYNYADPINGIDDDLDGYTDNFRGWDLGNNDNNPFATGNEHGTIVSGIAAGNTNNNKGIAGIGFKCKFLPVKAATDNPFSSIVQGYPGIVYAAEHGCKVINLSWGGPGGYSSAAQDIINYAAINYDIVVVAAAGNDNMDNPYYPASYDNVLSVGGIDTMYLAATDTFVEVKWSFSTYNYYVDISALGRRVMSTRNNGSYFTGSGTSFSCPIVAGAAGLVRSKYPALNALQVAELLRVTTDPLIDTLPQNILFKEEKMGKGRLNVYRALTDSVSPAVRMYEKHLLDNYGEYAFSGDTVKVKCKFINYLRPTSSSAQVTLSSTNPNITIVQGSHTLGVVPTLGNNDNYADPFVIYISPNAGINEQVIFRLGYEDPVKNYTDYQYFETYINPNFLDIDTNQVALTATSTGRFGYIDAFSTVGNGMVYKGNSIMYESGLMIGLSNSKVSDCVRGTPAGSVDNDFTYIDFIKYASLPEGDQGARCILTDTSGTNTAGVKVEQRTYAFDAAPDDKYIIVEYDVINLSGATMDSLAVGIYTDWDIQTANQNKANWDAQDSIGYTYFTGANGIYAGVVLLTNNTPECFSMDHATIPGNINPNDGFSGAEKFATLSNKIARPQAGGTGLGFDVSQVVGGMLYNVADNEKRTIAFAFVAGDDVLDLKNSARLAKDKFRSYNTSGTPVASDKNYCVGDTVDVTITPGNGTKFNFYNSATSSMPIYTGPSYTINNLYQPDTIYIKGIDSLFEGSADMVKINIYSEVNADFDFTPDTIDLGQFPYAFFVDKSDNATQINWDLGDGYTSTSSSFTHQYASTGKYVVKLTATGNYGCIDTYTDTIVVMGVPNGNFPFVQDGIKMHPNPASNYINVEFILDTPQKINIEIYNAIGESLISVKEYESIMLKNYKIDVSQQKKGIYIAKIQIGDKIYTRKFIIE
ncbi:MAG: S8 family serine peptidase [Cytophagaceae bacterium]|nr:S8 family serine peptidase [Cytophagaceae bacterium]